MKALKEQVKDVKNRKEITLERPVRYKYTTEELMELIDLFQVSKSAQEKIKEILQGEATPPCADPLFRYYNEHSKVVQFEKEFAHHLGVKYALGVNSGTSALIAALVALGIGPGDEVIVPGYTFFASVSAIVVARAIPVIAEIDESLTIDPEDIKKKITPRTKAIMVVHMQGHPARMDQIKEIAREHNLYIIEDTAQACGGKYQGKYLGTWGEVGCISLDAYKVIGSGEGGVVITDDEWLYTRAQSWHDTAACWRPDRYAKERREGELFCGENYRMSEMSGAIALAQLRKLDWINNTTRQFYHQLREEVKLPACAHWIEPADPAGVCGYSLGIIFDQVDQAIQAIKADIGLGGLAGGGVRGARDWHVYWYWEHILNYKTVTSEGCPFRCPHVKELPQYHEDMCPRTKDIMLRTTFFSIAPTDTSEWISQQAQILTKRLNELFS